MPGTSNEESGPLGPGYAGTAAFKAAVTHVYTNLTTMLACGRFLQKGTEWEKLPRTKKGYLDHPVRAVLGMLFSVGTATIGRYMATSTKPAVEDCYGHVRMPEPAKCAPLRSTPQPQPSYCSTRISEAPRAFIIIYEPLKNDTPGNEEKIFSVGGPVIYK